MCGSGSRFLPKWSTHGVVHGLSTRPEGLVHNSAESCPKTGVRATTSHPCSARPSSRSRPTPGHSTRHQDGSTSEPQRDGDVTTVKTSMTNRKEISGSARSEKTGKEPSTGENHPTPEHLRLAGQQGCRGGGQVSKQRMPRCEPLIVFKLELSAGGGKNQQQRFDLGCTGRSCRTDHETVSRRAILHKTRFNHQVGGVDDHPGCLIRRVQSALVGNVSVEVKAQAVPPEETISWPFP